MLIRILICFALGSIPFSVLAMTGTGIDIRKAGSGNPGFNNVLRFSKSRAIWALLGDMGKGAIALALVWLMFPPPAKDLPARGVMGYFAAHPGAGAVVESWILGLAAILGHCYSPWLKFKGVKGIATSAGVMLVLYPLYAVIALAGFTVVRLAGSRKRMKEAGALASLSSWLLFVLLMLACRGRVDAVCAAGIAAFLFFRHQKNLRHLFARRQEAPAQG
jgi:acyl phosphate:glycerol-3-phosphate acyltransferase